MARTLNNETLLSNTKFVNMAKEIYDGKVEKAVARYLKLTEGLDGKIYLFSSPGRAELIGNHTDHNHGLVLAGSINLDIACALTLTNDNCVTVKSEGYDEFKVDLNDLTHNKSEYGTPMSLVKGVAMGFNIAEYKVGGFRAHIDSNIFKGAGVSSSAAFELLFCEIFNVLFNEGKVDFNQKAIIARYAENVYFGKPSGLMDQLTISRGDVSYMDFYNENPSALKADWKFDNLSLVIINCGGDHCNLTDEYAAIRFEMNSIAEYFGKKVLAEVDKDAFFGSLKTLREKFSGRAILRAMHFFDENARVVKAATALKNNDEEAFLKLISQSGISSYTLLQNCYPPSDVEQSVPLALGIVSHHPDTLAYRVHGGGFAGTILCFVGTQNADNYVNYVSDIFGKENVFCVKVRKYGATFITEI